MLFWNEYHNHQIIDNRELSEIARLNHVPLKKIKGLDEKVWDWFQYAHIMSASWGFNVIYEVCFTYYVTLYLCGLGVSAGAEEEYFISKLDKRVMNIYTSSTVAEETEINQKKMFFNELVQLFGSDEILDYERNVFRHNIRVNKEVRCWFREQGNVHNTIHDLLVGCLEKPHLDVTMDSGKDQNIVFVLSYSEELMWRELSPFDDPDRLRVLLF